MEKKHTVTAQPLTNQTPSSRQSMRLAAAFISGCAVGALFVWGWVSTTRAPALLPSGSTSTPSLSGTSGQAPSQETASSSFATAQSSTTQAETFSPAMAQSGAVEVIDQPAGKSVVVQSVTVPPPGVWIAVRETQGTTLGNVLGAARVHGPRSRVIVDLLRATQPNRTYVVELYRPGAAGSGFSVHDSVYVDFDTGQPVIVPFHTRAATSTSSL